MLVKEETFDDKLAYNPSVLIDFENKILKSQYAEPESYENFVPDGWIGKYEDFTDDIPKNQRYWLDENNRCLIEQLWAARCMIQQFPPASSCRVFY